MTEKTKCDSEVDTSKNAMSAFGIGVMVAGFVFVLWLVLALNQPFWG